MEAEISKIIEIEKRVLSFIILQVKKIINRVEILMRQSNNKSNLPLKSAISECLVSIIDLKKGAKKTIENIERLNEQKEKQDFVTLLLETMEETKNYLREKERFEKEGGVECLEEKQNREDNKMLRERMDHYGRSKGEVERRKNIELANKVSVEQSSVKDDFGAKLLAKESHKRMDVFFLVLEAIRRDEEKFENEAYKLESFENTLRTCKFLAKKKTFKYVEEKIFTSTVEIEVIKDIKDDIEKSLNKNLELLGRLESEDLNSELKEQEELKKILLELFFNRKKENEEAEVSCFWERFVKQYFHEHVCENEDVKDLSAMMPRANVSDENSHESKTEEIVAKENFQSILSQIEQILAVPMEQRKVCSFTVFYQDHTF